MPFRRPIRATLARQWPWRQWPYVLWQDHLRFDPSDPVWRNRDRFVLSAGHASMLLYSMLHLTEVQAVNEDYEATGKPAVSLDEIKRFRQCTAIPRGTRNTT